MERNDATFFEFLHSSIEKGVLMSLRSFIKKVVKSEMENIFAITAVLFVLFTAMMDPYISVGIAVALLVALGRYKFVKRQKQERGYLNGQPI